jgi:ribonuclease HI
MNKPYVTIYTDGSLRKKKKGGWAALITCGPYWHVIADKDVNTTINRMELTAVIMALRMLNTPCIVTIVSDSQLTVNTINTWLDKWQLNGFMSSKKQPVANQDLLVQLAQLKEHHDVAAVWVRSHTKKTDMNSLGNAVVDEFAQILTR